MKSPRCRAPQTRRQEGAMGHLVCHMPSVLRLPQGPTNKAQKTQQSMSPPHSHPWWPTGNYEKGSFWSEFQTLPSFHLSLKNTMASFELCWKWYWLLPLVKINFSKFLELCFLEYQKLPANHIWILPITKSFPRALVTLLFFNMLLCWNQQYLLIHIQILFLTLPSGRGQVPPAEACMPESSQQTARHRRMRGSRHRQGPMHSAGATTLRRIFKEAEQSDAGCSLLQSATSLWNKVRVSDRTESQDG